MKEIIKLENIKRDFKVGDEMSMPCVVSPSRSTKANLSPSWGHPAQERVPC